MEFIIQLSNDRVNHSQQEYKEQYESEILYENQNYSSKKVTSAKYKFQKQNQVQLEDCNSRTLRKRREAKDQMVQNNSKKIRLEIKPQFNVVRIDIILKKNSKPITVESKSLKLMLMRYLNKLNSNIKYGYFHVDPQSGMVYLTLQSTLSKLQCRSTLKDVYSDKYNLMKEFCLNQGTLEYNFGKILKFLGEDVEEQSVIGTNLNEKDAK